MKTMNIAIVAVTIAAALGIGVIGLHDGKSAEENAEASRNKADGEDVSVGGATKASQARASGDNSDPSSAASGTPQLVAAQHANSESSEGNLRGPAIMSAENAKRAALVNGKLRAADAEFSDLMEILEKEGRDEAWAQQMENSFDVALRSHGPGYSGLEVDKVRCGRSVCVMSAVVRAGTSPTSPNADWSGLISNAFGEPWFGQNFMDTRTTLAPDDKGMIFISVFERKR